jgi:acyl-CoA thioesterase
MSMPHVFDDAVRLNPAGEHRYGGATHPAYANMVGPFGGITGAVLLQAALQHPAREGDPIALTVNFGGPVADGDFEVEARPLRTNRSTQHWTLLLSQGGVPCASGSAVFAQRRPTWSAPEAQPPHGLPPAAALERAPVQGRPAWVRCYDMRFAPGEEAFGLDGQEQDHSVSRLWVRDEPPRPLDFGSLAAISDSFFPRVFVRRRRLAPIGTVTLSTYFHADAALLAAQGDRHLLGTARALTFRHGYHDQSAEVWSDDGQLLASTHQMVYYRD